jgi:hypothetical protein
MKSLDDILNEKHMAIKLLESEIAMYVNFRTRYGYTALQEHNVTELRRSLQKARDEYYRLSYGAEVPNEVLKPKEEPYLEEAHRAIKL